MLRIGPFNYDPLRGVDLWLAQSDEFLLTHLSTSPEVEPPHFAMEVRRKQIYLNFVLSYTKTHVLSFKYLYNRAWGLEY